MSEEYHQVAHPGGEKTEGKEEAAESGRELYISDVYGRGRSVCPSSHQREAPDSFPFATCASLACICHS
jgi:hypothetical protein